ncbi:MAG: TRAP transporter substrate-binding protein DctP [Polaromonas sp.]|nr:TRAP transporter substrate-binding protein DctP [Polaromonas sp.]
MKKMLLVKRLALLGLATVVLSTVAALPAAAQEKMRISLDTNPSHVRNKGIEIFAAELKKRVGDKLVIEVYPSAQLFRDRDIAKALRQGAVEMGVPGTWQLDGIEPNAAIQLLPMFYGVEPRIAHQVFDGKLGEFLNKRMEERLQVKIIGRWLDLGMQHIYSTSKDITKYDDLKGMKIRSPGGTANAARIKGLGATSVLVPFPDLPLAMSQGVIDGLLTTHESAYSAKLYDSGLKYAFEDNQYLAQYVPMVSMAFWSRQPKEIQNAIVGAWETAVNGQREMAAKAQDEAREELIKHGVKIAHPSPSEIVAKRKILMRLQDDLVKEMKIDKEAINLALDALRTAKVDF